MRLLEEPHRFTDLLKAEIQKGLPGTEVQWQMASSDRMIRNFPRIPGADAQVAAVLILLYPHCGSIYTVFMQRPDYNGVHSGQISFPGGKKERTVLKGDIPSPVNPPSGCRFRTRCPMAIPACADDIPPLTDYGNGHLAACIRINEWLNGEKKSQINTDEHR
jgi:oligopeptide/dipeptide ABC transporter ATP-binding protein